MLYESTNNCLGLPSGLLTYDGVHPLSPRGAVNLANLHADGLLATLALHPLPPRPAPRPYGGRVFLTSHAYDLNLGGIAGADAICTREAGVPAKALLVDEHGCGGLPCRRATISPDAGDGQVDWVLQPDRMYYRMDNKSAIGFTGPNALFAFPLFFPVLAECTNQASGLGLDWTTRANSTCSDWHVGAGQAAPVQQGLGWSCARDNGLLDGGGPWACTANRFLCVSG